jgi:predicted ester cyclase
MNNICRKLCSPSRLFAILVGSAMGVVVAGPNDLIEPVEVIVDHSLPKATLDAAVLAGRRYDTFWNTGDEALARAALSPSFHDNTLPQGRRQGIEGVLQASKAFRTAVPDLRCEVRQLIVAGDRVVTHLHFTGHFSGSLGSKKGAGEVIDFIATDIYRIVDGRIVEDWHLEDNLTFLQQAGLVAK